MKSVLTGILDDVVLIGTAQQKMIVYRKMSQVVAMPFDIRPITEQHSEGT